MLKSGEMSDVIFQVDGKEVKAHKTVLAAASKYCRASFNDAWNKDEIIELDPDLMPHWVLEILVQAAYEVTIDWSTLEIAQEMNESSDNEILDRLMALHRGAEYWGMRSISSQVEMQVIGAGGRLIRLDNCERILQEARRSNAKNIQRLCMSYIDENKDTLSRLDPLVDEDVRVKDEEEDEEGDYDDAVDDDAVDDERRSWRSHNARC